MSSPEMPTPTVAAPILAAMAGRRILVVGDVFLDEYLIGRAERLSREGPVPVLSFRERFGVPGGAANPARNIASLGGRALQVGVAGDDAAAAELRGLLVDAGIDTGGLITDRSRPLGRRRPAQPLPYRTAHEPQVLLTGGPRAPRLDPPGQGHEARRRPIARRHPKHPHSRVRLAGGPRGPRFGSM